MIRLIYQAERGSIRWQARRDSFPELKPPARILLGPGPSNVHPRVMKAMLSPVLGHLDPEFVTIMEDIKSCSA